MLAALVLLSLVGCGGGADTPACPPPLLGSCTNHTGIFCTEYAGVPDAGAGALQSSCKGDPGEPDIWSASGCSHAGVQGACKRMQQGMCVAVWVKVPGDARAQAMNMCAAQGGTWVEP
jgi:hypothetical protein